MRLEDLRNVLLFFKKLSSCYVDPAALVDLRTALELAIGANLFVAMLARVNRVLPAMGAFFHACRG